MAAIVSRAIYNALTTLPALLPSKDRLLTRLFEDTFMFISANALLGLRGHPSLFITGYFTGIVLDKAVQENFEKIKRVIPFALLIPTCFGQEAYTYFIHTATFITACKIGSVMSSRYPLDEKETRPQSSWMSQNIFMLLGSGLLWLLRGHPVLLLAGFLYGTLFEKSANFYFEKIRRVAFGDPIHLLGHGWFGGAAFPYVFHAATFILSAKIGSILTIRYLPKPGGLS